MAGFDYKGAKMAKRTVEDIDKRIAQLKAVKDKITALKSVQKRKDETRQKIVLGGYLLRNEPLMVDRIKVTLTRDADRAVFGMPPLPKAPADTPPAL